MSESSSIYILLILLIILCIVIGVMMAQSRAVALTVRNLQQALEDKHRAMLGDGARLVTTIVASSWTEAMTRYNRYQGWGVYTPEPDWPDEPYPAEWVAEQRQISSDPATKSATPVAGIRPLPRA